MSKISDGVNFLHCCIEYAPDEDLAEITEEEAVSQVDGYKESFGDELPEILNFPYWFKVCWNRAVKAEKERRPASANNQKKIVLSNPELSFEISEIDAPLETIIELIERQYPGWHFDRTEARYTSCLMAIFTNA